MSSFDGSEFAGTLAWAGGALVAKVQTSEKTLVVDFSAHQTAGARAAALAFGAVMRNWRYDIYRTKLKASQKPQLEEIVIVGAGEGAEAAWISAKALADGVAFTKELVTEPANIIYPESFVARCREAMEGSGLTIEVLGQAEMEALGMGALLGVSQGSVRAPQLLIMKWNGGAEGEAPVALIGKGDPEAAIDALLELFRRDREWNDGASKAQLFKLFDSLGPKSEAVQKGRRRLSSMIFA